MRKSPGPEVDLFHSVPQAYIAGTRTTLPFTLLYQFSKFRHWHFRRSYTETSMPVYKHARCQNTRHYHM